MNTRHRTLITASGTGDSPHRVDCPSVHLLPGREEAYVVVRDDADEQARAALAGEFTPPHEVLGTQPRWVPCGLMDLPTLGLFMDAQLHTSGTGRFRLERLPTYNRASAEFRAWQAGDPPPPSKYEWLDELAADFERGARHSRVRIFSAELTDYELYACQHGYASNSAYEDIRVLRAGEHPVPELTSTGDFWIVNDIVLPVIYHADGRFVGAAHIGVDDERAQVYRDDAARAVEAAEPWGQWWDRHPELHEPGVA